MAPAPAPGPQRWAGAPAAALDQDGSVVLAYRVRAEDGDRLVIARSFDGEHTRSIGVISPGDLGAAAIERPALCRAGDGTWRMWVSLATPDSLHWYVGLLEARSPEELPSARLLPAFPGDPAVIGFKDPVVQIRDGRYRAWLCGHPLEVAGAEDRMITWAATSDDGLTWRLRGPVLRGRPGSWDARGARLTAVLDNGFALYDGRASAAENWFEQTGVAAPDPESGGFRPVGDGPAYDARYVTPLAMADGTTRIYYEYRLPDESHELRTELLLR